MSDKSKLLQTITGIDNFETPTGEKYLTSNFYEINFKFQEWEQDHYNDELYSLICSCHEYIKNIYANATLKIIYEFTHEFFNGSSIDFTLINYSQELIAMKFETFSINKGLTKEFKNDVWLTILELADSLNKRFCFDELSLISLIEASTGKNIIEETKKNNPNKVLSYKNGLYTLENSDSKRIYTIDAKPITNPNDIYTSSSKDRHLSSYPLGKNLSTYPYDTAMKKAMEYLFANLNLCIETYFNIYTSGDNIVKSEATLADGSKFYFDFLFNERNIPHLLGIPKASKIHPKALDILNKFTIKNQKPKKNKTELLFLNQESGALDVLKVLLANQKDIIDFRGLYEDGDKKYELIHWEKVVLKTASFMRSDFFKACFCLVKLDQNRFLVDPKDKGGFVSISSTNYGNEELISTSKRSVLYDLLKTRKQKRDFIFRGFRTDKDKNIPMTILTGKSETIVVEKTNELFRTLQRYRELFRSENDGMDMKILPEDSSIITSIENENYIKKFSAEEQASLGLSISTNLGFIPSMSKDALNTLHDALEENKTKTRG